MIAFIVVLCLAIVCAVLSWLAGPPDEPERPDAAHK